jgi:hypothetical protein
MREKLMAKAGSKDSSRPGERKPEQHIVTEKIYGRLTPYTKGGLDALRRRIELDLLRLSDDPNERRAAVFLADRMALHPGGLPGRTKDDFRRVCCARFGIADRAFKRLWDWALRQNDAPGFEKPGPRGPLKQPRRSPVKYHRP